ncbi:glycosyltransferase [uncultured Croceitalea sp.]|uniref:glycosyltransferase n=1 Tax=uncultured Croceitalea sp. TaxID=1798908 RepID=UPI003305F2A7
MKKALFIGYVWPEPKTTAAGHRMMQLLRAFKVNGFDITFATTATETSYSEPLEDLGIQIKSIVLNASSFDTFVQSLKPNVVVFDRFMVEEQFGWRVAEFAPDALRILNTEDLHSLRNARQDSHKKEETFTNIHWLKHDMTKREVASVYRSDLTLLVSTFEKLLLEKEVHIDSALLYHLPFLYDTIETTVREDWSGFKERKDFICFGNGKHAPNVDAIRWLKEVIWPLIRTKLPDAQLHVYGAYLPQYINEMHNVKNGFLVQGWIDDLDTALQKTKVNLAPLRFGAGIKGKLTQAMRNGTPTVTTTIGVEGMLSNLSFSGMIADNAEKFAADAFKLYSNEVIWKDKQNNGTTIINKFYNKEKLTLKFFEILESLMTNLSSHREANFIGNLLQHQSLASTKYMAKWIEEKNKNQ